jgi:hypothetical protein
MVAQPGRVTQPKSRLERDQVHPHGQRRQRRPIREDPDRHQPGDRATQMSTLAPVECLLRQAEATVAPPAHFDDDERRRRSGIDSHEVELTAPHAHATTEDRPTVGCQRERHSRFGVVPDLLLRGASAGHATDDATRRSPATYPADDSSSGSPGPTAAHSSVCSTSAHEANVSRWIEVVPNSRRPALCSGAA